MSESAVVIAKIAAMFLVMLLGYAARRRGRVDLATTTLLGSLTADVCLPALTFTQLLATVDAGRLAAGWMVPLLGAGVIVLGQLVSIACRRLFATPAEAPTFVFLGAMANWIYLPLPIVLALYGERGVEALLLSNAGAQLVLWTAGVATLRGGRVDAAALRALVTNPGLLATAAGIAGALLLPESAALPAACTFAGKTVLDAITLIGSLTIPLSLLVTGSQLGATPFDARPRRATIGVLLVRLALTPALALALVWLAPRAGLSVPRLPAAIAVLVAAMPVAVSCSILTERYRQDTGLAAQSIFHSTALSVLSVPLWVWLFQRVVP
jgi:predicted permease